MDFAIPHGKTQELALYIWKIINVPLISESDLLYQISFDLTLLSPVQAKKFLHECIKKKILEKNNDEFIKLTHSLEKKLIDWQTGRRNSINGKIERRLKSQVEVKQIETNKTTEFGTLIKLFSENSVLNRAVAISDDAFKITAFDVEKGKIIATVKGSNKNPYKIEFDLESKFLKHDCHDFTERKSKEHKFCKHLTKFFLLIKPRDETAIIKFLENMASEIDDWSFSS